MTVSSSGGCCSSSSSSGVSTSGFPTAGTMDQLATNYGLIAAEQAMIQQAILAAASQCQPGGGQFCTTVGGNTPMTFVSGVGSVTVNNGGLNYFQDSPSAIVVPPIGSGGNGAVVSLVTNGGNITAVNVISGGTGYQPVNSTLSVTSVLGIGAILQPLVNGFGGIQNVNIVAGGAGYVIGDTITATRAVAPNPLYINAVFAIVGVGITGAITNIAVLNPGTGYQPSVATIEIVSTINPSVPYPLGTGFGAAVLTTNSEIMSLGTITGGSGYTNGLFTNIPLTGGSGSGAVANITVAGGSVTSVVLTHYGNNYLIGDMLSASSTYIDGGIATFGTLVGGINYGAAINTLGVFTGGSFYTPAVGTVTYPGVSLTGGTGTGATANITVFNGSVSAVVLVSHGTGYLVGDILSATAASIGGTGAGFAVPVNSTLQTFAAVPLTGGTGTAATANITVTNGVVTSVAIVVTGTNYTVDDFLSAATATIGGNGSGFIIPVATLTGVGFIVPVASLGPIGTVQSVIVYDTGYGYAVDPPYLVITDAGTGAQTSVTLGTGLTATSVASITVINPGENYDQLATGAVFNPATAMIAATAAATVSAGGFTGITGLIGGGYYTSPPTVTITGDGSGASATAVISSGRVTGLTGIVPGSGYTMATVSFSPPANPPNPTPAVVTINVPVNPYNTNGNAYYQAWAGTQCNAALSGQLNSILSYFTQLGYSISLQTNPTTGTTLQWLICW